MGIFFPPDPNMPRVFLDASVIISGVASRSGGSHALLVLAEIGLIRAVICPYVFEEAARNIQAKLPKAIPIFELLKANIHWETVPDAADAEILPWLTVIRPKDAPVLAAAIKAKPHRFVTLDNRDFLRSPDISQKSGIKICTPGDVMQEIRSVLAQGFQL